MFKQIRNEVVVFLSNMIKKHTKIMIKSVLDFEKLVKKSKKLIVIFGTLKSNGCQRVLFKYPLFFNKAKKTKIILKFCDMKSHKSFKNIGIKTTPTLRYYKKGKLVKTIEYEKDILHYLKNI